MPRKPRIDAPGMVLHIVARGIERRQIFIDDRDRNFFLGRLADLVQETENPLYTFALMPNHFHLLIRRGKTPVSTLMQRLLTAYAIYFNKRHDRTGHLFQNRYKSYFCVNEAYFFELLRYINLNPVRAGLCSHEELENFRYAGHSYFMGKRNSAWLDSDAALCAFGNNRAVAREAYARHIAAGVVECTSGQPINAGMECATAGQLINAGIELATAGQPINAGMECAAGVSSARHFLIEGKNEGDSEPDLAMLYATIVERCGVTQQELHSKSRTRRISLARAELANAMSKQLGLTRSEIARQLAVNPSAVSKMLSRR